MKINLDSKSLFHSQRMYNLIVFVNNKEVELSVALNYDVNVQNEGIDWEYLKEVDLTNEESDLLDDYINKLDWLKKE